NQPGKMRPQLGRDIAPPMSLSATLETGIWITKTSSRISPWASLSSISSLPIPSDILVHRNHG
ncbi:hypothetical protein GOODEAATRI_025623, partial [Goodea atripinnis]